MKEQPILFSTEMVKAILDGVKTQTRRVITPQTSTVGVGKVDWSKFDWNGETKHDCGDMRYSVESKYVPNELKGQKIGIQKAPLPFVDGQSDEYQYLHVPWNWSEDGTIFRIYPKWDVGDRLWVRETHYRYGRWVKNGFTKTGKQAWKFLATTDEVRYFDDRPFKLYAGKTREWVSEHKYSEWYKRPSIFLPKKYARITLEITGLRAERLRSISTTDAIAEGGYTIDEFITMYLKLNRLPKDADPWNWVIEFNAMGVRLK